MVLKISLQLDDPDSPIEIDAVPPSVADSISDEA